MMIAERSRKESSEATAASESVNYSSSPLSASPTTTNFLPPPTSSLLSNIFENVKGGEAWNYNLSLATLAASKVKSCLGPKGAYKMVTYYRGPELVVKVTKDAADIVEELGVQYPAVKTIAEAAKIHRQQVGDGVSTLLILVFGLLIEAKKMIDRGIDPNTILDGYYNVMERSIAVIDEVATNSDQSFPSRDRLLQTVDCGRYLLSPKLRRIVSEAVDRLSREEADGSLNPRKIRITKKPGGSTEDSELIRGIIFKKGKAHSTMPDRIDAPRVAIVSKKIDIKPLELKMRGEGPPAIRLNITSGEQLHAFKSEENRMRAAVAERVKSAGASVLLCRSKIDDAIAAQLGSDGILALQLVEQEDLDATAKATGARQVAEAELLDTSDLGLAEKIEVDRHLPDVVTILSCSSGTTLLLRGSSLELVQELEKTIRNAMLVLKHSREHPKVIPGAGAIFIHLALKIRDYALSFPGREQLAMNSFANALELIPELLASNYGLDAIDVMTQLRSYHSNGKQGMGVGEAGCLDAQRERICELASINKATIRRAFELVALMLRVDSFFYVKEFPVFHKQ